MEEVIHWIDRNIEDYDIKYEVEAIWGFNGEYILDGVSVSKEEAVAKEEERLILIKELNKVLKTGAILKN